MAEKIEEYLKTGKIKKYEEVMADIPEGLLELLNISNVGPKTLQLLHKELGVNNLADLEKVLKEGKLSGLPGMGEKKEENISKGVFLYKAGKARMPLAVALRVAKEFIKPSGVRECLSRRVHRRMKETIGDIDILATGDNVKILLRHLSVSRMLKRY